eukprot:m.166878 g.166878  ORF g.166878 m.166878 type:complete len:434 (+) comp18175_c0_seq1:482-1783(+)
MMHVCRPFTTTVALLLVYFFCRIVDANLSTNATLAVPHGNVGGETKDMFLSISAEEARVVCFITNQATNDLFFRVLYLRYIMLGAFAEVDIIPVTPVQGENIVITMEKKILGALDQPHTRVLVGVLRNQGFHLLRRGAWNSRIGILLIDDEKYETETESFIPSSFLYRNYFQRERISSERKWFYFPLGWRTTDGEFFGDHEREFSAKFLNDQAENPHAKLVLTPIVPASLRRLRAVFAGQIREGGRADMERVLNDMHGRSHGDVSSGHVRDVAVGADSCTLFENASRLLEHLTNTAEKGDTVPCADALLTSKHFLGNTLGVRDYYTILRQAKYALAPCGINPESYRFWEGLHAGAIPIIETCGDPWQHPLKALQGAIDVVPHVWDWAELPALLRKLEQNSTRLDELQREISEWYKQYMHNLVHEFTTHVSALQ